MENVNISLVFSFVTGILSLFILITVIRKQFYEILLPKDWLTGLRWIILGSLLVSLIGIVPVLVYQLFRLFSIDNEFLRNVAGVTGSLSRLSGAVLLFLIYEYKKTD